MKTSLIGFVSVLILGACALASAGSVRIETDSKWITGKAENAPLGQVLEIVAEKIGCDVYIDAPLADVPTSFTIEKKLTPEEAIQRMVRPHSYAMVFGEGGGEREPRILEVWVFRKGQQHSASYLPLKVQATRSQASEGGGAGDFSSSPSLETPGKASGSIQGSDLVRRDLHVERSAFGTPAVQKKNDKGGPDYRPNPYQMQLAYMKYQWVKHREERRMAEVSLRQARANAQKNREIYLSERNQELKDEIMKSKQNQ